MGRYERQAANYFEDLFDRTKRLEPEINVGEKGKISDGFVNVYNKEYNAQSDHSLKDGSFVGRVLVQVKGQLEPQGGNPTRTYPFKRAQLENMVRVGGLIFLLAEIPRSESEVLTPYYADLAPANARFWLEQMKGGQKEKSVPLNRFPTDPEEVIRLISHLRERLSENSIIAPDSNLMQNIDGLTVTTPNGVDYSRPQLLGGPGSSAIITANKTDGRDQVIETILQITPEEYGLVRNDELSVSCGGVEFRDTRRRRLPNGQVEFYVSPGISFVLGTDRKCKFNLKFQPDLYHAAKDLAFVENLVAGETIRFNGVDSLRVDAKSTALKEYLSARPFLDDMKMLCAYFAIDPVLFPVANLGESSVEELRSLSLHIRGNAEIDFDSAKPRRRSIDLAGSQLQLMWVKTESGWRVRSFFDAENVRLCAVINDSDPESAHHEPVTAFEFFSASELGAIVNLNPDQLLTGYRWIGGERASELASATVFKLLRAADETPHRRRELLGMAQKLNDWILEREPENVFVDLNGLQVRKRLGTLDQDDLQRIENYRKAARSFEFGDDSLFVEAASNVLAGQFDGVRYVLAQMGKEERESFERSTLIYLYEIESNTYELDPAGISDDWRRVEDQIERKVIENVVRYRLGQPTDYDQN